MNNKLILLVLLFIGSTAATCSQKTRIPVKDFHPLKQKMDLKDFSTECQKFIKKELRPNWLLHSSQDCYYDNQPLWESVLANKECFKGKKRAQIQSIFGSPTEVVIFSGDQWDKYFLGKVCEKDYWYFSLQFHYDEKEVLKNIGQGQVGNH